MTIKANVTGTEFVVTDAELNNNLIAAHLNELWQRVRELETAVAAAGIELPNDNIGFPLGDMKRADARLNPPPTSVSELRIANLTRERDNALEALRLIKSESPAPNAETDGEAKE